MPATGSTSHRSPAREFHGAVREIRQCIRSQIILCGGGCLQINIPKRKRGAIGVAKNGITLCRARRQERLSCDERHVARALYEDVVFVAGLASFKGYLSPFRSLLARTQVE